MPSLTGGDSRFSSDDGAADPDAAAALAAFAAGAGSEHAVLTALARTRLLVPVVAAPGPTAAQKAAEMGILTLVGHDGRPAVPAFTCLDALVRWQPAARPVPVEAGRVWQSAAADASAVVLDIAGPVPVAIDGARLAALAGGQPVPLPHADPDVLAAVTRAIAGYPAIGAVRLLPGGAGSDLTVELVISPGSAQAAAGLARHGAAAVMASLGSRLRRGIQVVIGPPQG